MIPYNGVGNFGLLGSDKRLCAYDAVVEIFF